MTADTVAQMPAETSVVGLGSDFIGATIALELAERDIRRKIDGDEALEVVFAIPLGKAGQIRRQRQNQCGWKLYSWHAPETECISKGKAH